jgi:hypothetical protein
MEIILFAEANRLWYALPLIVVISLVYGATRHELCRPILEHALRFGAWIVGFMAILGCVMWLLSRRL